MQTTTRHRASHVTNVMTRRLQTYSAGRRGRVAALDDSEGEQACYLLLSTAILVEWLNGAGSVMGAPRRVSG